MKRFTNKVVVITGAASGLGRATAKRLAEEDAKLVLVDRNQQALENVAAELGGGSLVQVTADVSREEDVRDYVRQSLDA